MLRSDTNERLDVLKKAQIESIQKLSEMGSKALVEALRDVMKDFNNKITEQFGDNFKQLNEAVAKILTWQSEYKIHIQEMTARHTKVIGLMKRACDNYAELVKKADSFTCISSDLSRLLSSLEVQKQQLVANLQALADLLKAASGSLPEIEKKVMELTAQLTRAVETTQKEVSRGIAENVQLIRVSVQEVGRDLTNINQDFNKHVGQLAESTKKQVAILDAALTEELSKSLKSLGCQITSLSEKFVSDYIPLTNALRDIVRIARQ